MRAAIYARKSTDDNDRNLDNKSVTRQVDNAKDFAEANGWLVSEDMIFVDDGISGAEFKDRPGLSRMLNSLESFDVLVMSEASRLGRDMTRNAFYLGEITDHDVRVFYYLSREEEKFNTPETRLMATLRGYASEVEREKASQRSRDALERKAKRGYNTGGVVYGYDNVPVYAVGHNGEQTKTHTDYAINREQASVILGIFAMYSDGHGFKAIARTLNGDNERDYPEHARKYFGGLRPAAPRKGTGSWSPSVVREMLLRERYVGKVPWGEHKKVYKGGTQTRQRNDVFLHAERPDLRIVPDELWGAVQKRLAGMRVTYRKSIDALAGSPGRASRYLLSGLGRCSVCGARIVSVGGTKGSGNTRRNAPMYGCSHHHNRGSAVCSNKHKVYQEEAESAVLDCIQKQIMTPHTVDQIVEQALHAVKEAMKKPDGHQKQIKGLQADLVESRRVLERLSQALASTSTPLETVLEMLGKQEQRKKQLEQELEVLQRVIRPKVVDESRLRRLLASRIEDFRGLMLGDVATARKALGVLLDGEIVFSPVVRDDAKTLAFSGKTKAGAFSAPAFEVHLATLPGARPNNHIRMASPRGFEPRYLP